MITIAIKYISSDGLEHDSFMEAVKHDMVSEILNHMDKTDDSHVYRIVEHCFDDFNFIENLITKYRKIMTVGIQQTNTL